MIKAILPALVVALLAPGAAVYASAQDGAPAPEPQAALADEALLLEDMPVVFTAAKKEQLASEAPSSITVTTAEDIRRSGANSIPEALRFVVGLDVFQETATSWLVNARLAQTLKAGDLELAVSVFNLFDERHQEYIDSPVVGRRVSVSAHYRY